MYGLDIALSTILGGSFFTFISFINPESLGPRSEVSALWYHTALQPITALSDLSARPRPARARRQVWRITEHLYAIDVRPSGAEGRADLHHTVPWRHPQPLVYQWLGTTAIRIKLDHSTSLYPHLETAQRANMQHSRIAIHISASNQLIL